MNYFLMLFMNNWLMNLTNLSLIYDRLRVFMDHRLMMLMNYVLVVLMNHIFVVLVYHLSVRFLYNWSIHVSLNSRSHLVLLYQSTLGMSLYDISLFMADDRGSLHCFLDNRL